jgi:formate dehydrogenase major subunit
MDQLHSGQRPPEGREIALAQPRYVPPLEQDRAPVRPVEAAREVQSFKRGLGHFHFFSWEESSELKANGKEFPFILTTGRLLEHYNCGTMTRRTGNSDIVTMDVLALNPADAAKKQIQTGDQVRLFSARGEVELEARVTDEVKPGILYTTFHFPDAMVNNVTGQGCDADTMCPEYKVIAADVEFVSAGKPKKKRMMEMV